MAEVLVLLKVHWMDLPGPDYPHMTGYEYHHLRIDKDVTLSTVDKIRTKERWTLKYAMRNQPGDWINVREDWQKWGSDECLPDFCIFGFLGIPAKYLRPYIAHYRTGEEGARVVKRKQEWQFRLDDLPARIKADALTKGEVAVTLTDVKDALYSHKLEHTEWRTVIRG